LEKRAEKIQMKVYLYQYPLLKVSVLEESEKWHRLTKRIGEEMIRRQAWYRWDTNGEKECEVRKYLAESYFKLGENLKAAEQYEQIRKLESNEEELEEIYEKLQLIYEEAQEYEKVWEISREAVEVLPDSERLWMNYLERYCENPEMERELCAEAVKKAIQAVPELAESEAFKQLQGKYKIVIDGENIRVGE
jgi:tetratricopeptide (TPR) repeat protein